MLTYHKDNIRRNRQGHNVRYLICTRKKITNLASCHPKCQRAKFKKKSGTRFVFPPFIIILCQSFIKMTVKEYLQC